jgi:phosphatidylglycerol:prolipoprotein diacylglycerol transferase
VIGLYLVLYSTVRFVIEFFRNHEQGLVLGLSLTQWISAGLFALGVGILLWGDQLRRSRIVKRPALSTSR